jgi:hypothetical protein
MYDLAKPLLHHRGSNLAAVGSEDATRAFAARGSRPRPGYGGWAVARSGSREHEVLQYDGGVFVELESDAVALAWLGLRFRSPTARPDRITPISNVPLPRPLQPTSADLRAAELQDHAIGVLQLNASSPSRKGTAGADRAVRAFD